MTKHARGTFVVQMNPLDQDDLSKLGRLSLDKQFQGDLQAIGKGQMLTAVTSVDNSAGYVAIERVTGTLHGRSGSFVLLHRGMMDRGIQDLTITIVPDSGTDALVGLSGTLSISIDENGAHSYDLAYTFSSDLPIKLASPAQRALAQAGIYRLEQFTQFRESEVRQLHGMGPKALEQIRQTLTANGLAFADEETH